MKIEFSRHAKRRAKLYNISEAAITEILTGMNLRQGENEIIREVAGFRYPLKIIVFVEGVTGTVITTYPLKKGKKK